MRHFISFAVLALAGCQADPFTQIGYFKDDGPNRVMVFQMDETANAESLVTKIETLPHTAGQFTIAYIFEVAPPSAPDPVTNAPHYVAANEAMFAQPLAWRWRHVIQPDGTAFTIDCSESPSDAHCLSPE